MERKIGEEFDVKIRVRAVESVNGFSCRLCALVNFCILDDVSEKISTCYPVDRTDGKNVYYELVTYEEV